MFYMWFQNQSPTFSFKGDHAVGFQNIFLKPHDVNLSCEESPSVLYELAVCQKYMFCAIFL